MVEDERLLQKVGEKCTIILVTTTGLLKFQKDVEMPYKDIYTTVLIIKTPGGVVLFDTATYDEDVKEYIIPALAQLNITAEMLKYIVISHNHRDHAGGLERLMQKYPNACIVSRSEALGEKYCGYNVLVPEDGHYWQHRAPSQVTVSQAARMPPRLQLPRSENPPRVP